MEPLGSLVAVISIFGGLAAVSLVARLYTRFLLVRQPGWDDALVVVGMVSGVALNVVAVFYVRDYWNEAPRVKVRSALSWFLSILFSLISSSFTKISIVVFYRRVISRSMSKSLQRILLGLMAFIIIQLIALSMVFIFTCRPVNYYWEEVDDAPGTPRWGTCYNDAYGSVISSGLGALTDIAVIIIPFFMLKGLSMERKQKWGLFALFSFGIFTCVAGVLKVVFLIKQNIYAITEEEKLPEGINLETQCLIWYIVEAEGGIACACVPALKPLYVHIFGGRTSLWPASASPWYKYGKSDGTRGPHKNRYGSHVQLSDVEASRGGQPIVSVGSATHLSTGDDTSNSMSKSIQRQDIIRVEVTKT